MSLSATHKFCSYAILNCFSGFFAVYCWHMREENVRAKYSQHLRNSNTLTLPKTATTYLLLVMRKLAKITQHFLKIQTITNYTYFTVTTCERCTVLVVMKTNSKTIKQNSWWFSKKKQLKFECELAYIPSSIRLRNTFRQRTWSETTIHTAYETYSLLIHHSVSILTFYI